MAKRRKSDLPSPMRKRCKSDLPSPSPPTDNPPSITPETEDKAPTAFYFNSVVMEALTAALACPPVPERSRELRNIAACVITDAFSRKVLMDFFIETLNAAMMLNETLRRLETMVEVEQALESGDLTTTSVKAYQENMLKIADVYRKKLLAKIQLLAQCSTVEDTKH